MLAKRIVVAVSLLVLPTAIVVAQRRPKSRTTSPPAAKTGTLSFQAGIVYRQGGPQPVARVEFHLLDDDLEKILEGAGLTGSYIKQNLGLVSKYAMARIYRETFVLLTAETEPENKDFLTKAQLALQPHIKATVTTDFSGNAQFQPVPAGTYYVLGITETRGGFAIWNLKVEIKSGQNQITLDQNNAARAN